MKALARQSTLLFSVLALAGCDWFDGNSVDLEPTAEITFPSRDAMTAESTLTVRGTAGDDRQVTGVTVNGVNAISDDGFATWTADIDLSFGANAIVVDVADNSGRRVTAVDEVDVERRIDIRRPFSYEIDIASNTMYFLDLEHQKIMTADLSNGEIREFADTSMFQPATLPGRPPIDLALDLANNRIFLTIRDLPASGTATEGIWAYDTQAETWSAFSDDATVQGAYLVNPSDIIMDAANSRLLVLDFDLDAVIAVSLANGAQTLLSSNTVPNTQLALFGQPIDAELDAASNRLLVVDRESDTVFAIDLSTGARTLVTGNGTGLGTGLAEPLAITMDTANNRALVYDRRGARGIIAVDLTSGERSMFAGNYDSPTGTHMVDVRSLEIVGSEVIAFDALYDHVIGIDLSTGVRRVITNNGFPRGSAPPALDALRKVGDSFYGHAYVAVGRINEDNSVDILAGDITGGPASLNMNDVAIDAAGEIAYSFGAEFVNNQFDYQVHAVDLSDGTSTVISSGSTPNANNLLQSARDVALDEVDGDLYTLESTRVMRVDLTTGERTIVSDVQTPAFVSPRKIAVDKTNNRLIVADAGFPNALAIDMTTGLRTPFADTPAPGESVAENLYAVTVANDGTVWALDLAGRLTRIDSQTGAREIVVDVDDLTNSYMQYWYDLATDDELVYIDAYYGVLEVDPKSGDQVTIYATPEGSAGNST